MRTFFLVLSISCLLATKVEALDHQHSATEHTEHHDHREGQEGKEITNPSIGPDKAVLSAVPQDGLRLSEQAKRVLGLSFSAVQSAAIHRIPVKGIVYHQLDVGVYRLRNGWIKLIDVQVLAKTPLDATVKSSELKPGDQVVIDGVSLLRVAELDAWSESSE